MELWKRFWEEKANSSCCGYLFTKRDWKNYLVYPTTLTVVLDGVAKATRCQCHTTSCFQHCYLRGVSLVSVSWPGVNEMNSLYENLFSSSVTLVTKTSSGICFWMISMFIFYAWQKMVICKFSIYRFIDKNWGFSIFWIMIIFFNWKRKTHSLMVSL